jgi:hypothetical protein
MNEQNNIYCVCAPITMDNPHENSIVGACVKCGSPLFYMPHNISHKKICIDCFRAMPRGPVYVKKEDVLTAEEMLARMKK